MSHLRISERVPQTAEIVVSLLWDIEIAQVLHEEPTPLVKLDTADHAFVYLVDLDVVIILEDVALR